MLHSIYLFIYRLNNFWKNKKIKIFIRNIFFNFSFLKILLFMRKLGRHKQNGDRHCEPVTEAL